MAQWRPRDPMDDPGERDYWERLMLSGAQYCEVDTGIVYSVYPDGSHRVVFDPAYIIPCGYAKVSTL